MSQVSNVQAAAGLFIFTECMTRKEFTDKFNKTFDTKHDEIDFAITFNEWELAGVISRIHSKVDEDNTLYMPVVDDFNKVMISTFRRSINVEQSHIRAYWSSFR
jgi:hypothetical protein